MTDEEAAAREDRAAASKEMIGFDALKCITIFYTSLDLFSISYS